MMTEERFPSELSDLMGELRAEDHERIAPPDEIWSGIEAAVADQPVSLMSRRNRHRSRTFLLAAAAVVLVVGIIGVVVQAGDSPQENVVAMTAITSEGLPLAGPDGTARLLDVDGQLQLELDLASLPDAIGFYEVWIIDTDVQGMFSLGVVDAEGDGRFKLPDGVDPGDFPVVDISAEPIDGDPTHSGQSILRGVLDL